MLSPFLAKQPSRARSIKRCSHTLTAQVRGHPNIVDILGICGASSVSEYYDVHLDDLVLSAGAKPLPISYVVSRCGRSKLADHLLLCSIIWCWPRGVPPLNEDFPLYRLGPTLYSVQLMDDA